MTVSEEQVLEFLRHVETGEVTLEAQQDPQIHIKSDILYEASNGWKIEVSNWGGQFSGIVEIILPSGDILDLDYLDEHMAEVRVYFPDKDVEWLAYKMKETIIGYIYKPHDKLGIFETCQAGDIITNPDREPPWIIVNHSLQDTIVAHWPGRLWCAEAVDILDPQDHRGNYTRCVSVKIVKEEETDWLFGPYGTKIEDILHYASKLNISKAEILAGSRSDTAKSLQSQGWHRWMAKEERHDRDPQRDMSGVVVAGSQKPKSPIGHGLSCVHRCVWDSAKREVGDAAFDEDEEEMWMKPPWSKAASALLDAAWALGVPDLFSEAERETLLAAWNERNNL